MDAHLVSLRIAIAVFATVGIRSIAAPVATPTFDPPAGALSAPVKVTLRCATPDATIHVTLDGKEPTPRDAEVDPDSSIVIDEPLTLKAKAWLPDGNVSATATANFPLQPIPGDGSSFVDQSAPALMAVGRTYTVAVTLRNIGTRPWQPRTHFLTPHRPKDAATWRLSSIQLAHAAPTWATATFTTKVTAPPEPGTYNLRFRMHGNGAPFGEPTPVVRVAVMTAEEYEREISAQADNAKENRTAPGESGVTPLEQRQPLTAPIAVALAEAQARMRDPAARAELERLVRELSRSGHSFKYLRTIGFTHSDQSFEKLIADHPALLRSTRIIRRNEQGQRVIPGWPAVALHTRLKK